MPLHMGHLVFAVQATLSFATFGFCAFMLALGKDDNEKRYYLPILTSVTAYWLPAPRCNPSREPDLPNLRMRHSLDGGSDVATDYADASPEPLPDEPDEPDEPKSPPLATAV